MEECSLYKSFPPRSGAGVVVGMLRVVWFDGFLILWFCGFMFLWYYGFMALWFCSFMVLLFYSFRFLGFYVAWFCYFMVWWFYVPRNYQMFISCFLIDLDPISKMLKIFTRIIIILGARLFQILSNFSIFGFPFLRFITYYVSKKFPYPL